MNRVMMVTGGVRNTGLAIARRFAREGYDVILTSRKAEDAQRTAAALGNEFPGVRFLP